MKRFAFAAGIIVCLILELMDTTTSLCSLFIGIVVTAMVNTVPAFFVDPANTIGGSRGNGMSHVDEPFDYNDPDFPQIS